MASNSTLLAIQCATGVPVPRFHLHRNLVTKTHNPTFKAANPAVQYEAGGALVSSPSQFHRNLVSKRDKIIAAAFPIAKEYTTDIPEYTVVKIENHSGEDIKLNGRHIWEGYQSTEFPVEIPNQGVSEFRHNVLSEGEVIGSVAGLEYLIKRGGAIFKWVIAWRNAKNELNKVYTKILGDEDVDWYEVKSNLDRSGNLKKDQNPPYSSVIVIDQTSATPTVEAILKLALLTNT